MKNKLLILILLLLAWLCLWSGFRPVGAVTHRFNTRTEKSAWVWVDSLTRSGVGEFEGDVYLPTSRRLWIDNSAGAQITLTLAGQEVYTGTESATISISDEIASPAHFTLTYTLSGEFPVRGVIGLGQELLPGVHLLIPAWHYADSTPLLTIFRAAFIILSGTALAVWVYSLRLSRQAWFWLTLIFALALGVRLLVLHDKFNADPTLWTMEKVWDNYVLMGREWLAGIIRVGGNAFQQGTFVYWGIIQYLIGPYLGPLYIFHAVIGAFVPVSLLCAAWLLFNRRIGITTGILAALYPPLIHYQLTLQDTAPIILIVSLILYTLAVYRRDNTPAALIITGALIGVGAMFRSTVLVMTLAVAGIIWLRQRSFSRLVLQSGLVGTVALLCILPVTAANYTAGVPTLTANLFDYQIFRSNSLNSVGLNTFNTQSEQLARARRDTWLDALSRETARNPSRLVELTARRIALFWDPVEHADSGMVDYESTGLAVSPLLNLLVLGGIANQWTLMVLAVAAIGLGLTDRSRRPSTLALTFLMGVYMLSLALFYVIGRVRIPLSPVLLILAAAGGTWIVQAYKQQFARTAAILLASAALGGIIWWLVTALPRPNFIAQPPVDMLNTPAQFDDTLRLIGYAHYDTDYQVSGYLTLEMVWQSLQQMNVDYVVSVRFVDRTTNTVLDAQNFTLGSLSVPPVVTTTWNANTFFYERYLLILPPTPTGCELYVGVYDPVHDRLLTVSGADRPVQDNHVRLTAAAVGVASVYPPLNATLAQWGDALRLAEAICSTGATGESTVRLLWQVDQRIPDEMTLFIHALHDGALVAQTDQRPAKYAALDGLPVGSVFETAWIFNSATAPQMIRLGLYDWLTNRWIVTRQAIPGADNTVEITCS